MIVGRAHLVEREGNIVTLIGAVDRARDGEGGVVSIEGTPGIGKTALLDVTAEYAESRGMAVLGAVANELEADFPFGVARQLLERRLALADAADRRRLLAGAARLSAPALGIDEIEPSQGDADFGHLHGLYWLVANLSTERPLLLSVDDLPWADLASLRFLLHLARRIAELPVVLAVTRRTDEPVSHGRLLSDLSHGPATMSVAPKPLSEAGSARLLGMGLERPLPVELVARLHAETAGNPFFLREISREILPDEPGVDQGAIAMPSAVSRSILFRLHRLGPDVVALAEAIVVLGDGCSPDEAAALAGLTPEAGAAAGAAMVRAALLASDGAERFVHPLVRGVIEGERTPAERAVEHARAARLLIDRGAPRDRIVAQLLSAAPEVDGAAAGILHDAGREALRQGAPASAARHLRRALQVTPGDAADGLLGDLGVALVLDEQSEEAVPILSRARTAASGRPEELADLTMKTWIAMLALGMIDEGVAMIEQTVSTFGEQHREARLMLEGEYVTAALFDPTRLRDTWRRLGRFEDLPGDSPAERRLLSMLAAMSQYEVAHPARELAELARRAYGGGRLIDENPLDPTKWVWSVGALIGADRVEEGKAGLAAALASARSTGSLDTLVMVHSIRAWFELRLGRLEDGEADALEGLGRIREVEATVLRELCRLALVRWVVAARVATGRLEEADRALAEHGLDGELVGGGQHMKLHRERAHLRLAQGRPSDALDEATKLADFHRRQRMEDMVEAPWRDVAALAHIDLGDLDSAAALADEHLAVARRWDLPRDVGNALRVRALAEPDPGAREELLREGLANLATSPDLLGRSQTQAALGRTMLRSGHRSEAKEILMLALDGATRCGAAPLAATVRSDLTVAGARPRRAVVSGVESLTAAERRIAEPAAAGSTNREIAQALFLSVRTVENTLARTYRKLRIGSRRDLAEALSAQDHLSPRG